MLRILLAAFLLVTSATSSGTFLEGTQDNILPTGLLTLPVPTYKIDLSKDPKERWKIPITAMKADILALFELYREEINKAVNFMFRIAELTSIDTGSETYKEIEGIAEILDIPTHELIMINYLYELDAYCTSIVGRMPNGTLFLARNLDFYFPEETRKLLFNAHFTMGDRLVFEAPMFAGTIGIFTALKPGAFALAVNERTSKTSSIDFLQNIAMLFTGYE